jgi:hypothetical protein
LLARLALVVVLAVLAVVQSPATNIVSSAKRPLAAV